MLTGSRLERLLKYDPETGIFNWRRYRKGVAGWDNGNRYVQITVDQKHYLAHRLAWLWMTGRWPEHEIDHIDGNSSNNAFRNLRCATSTQNKANTGARSRSLSGLKGASWHKSSRKWRSRIRIGDREIFLGMFNTAEEAGAAYFAAAKTHFGEFARAS
ncbi:HNH endonuclease [Bradyrhizobium sp. 26S5]|uniref:HNH endonuclease n=1 Tax=Bradyrhizobium sp. 26S5 TaxID=3139729 RepID=UPI0030CD621D